MMTHSIRGAGRRLANAFIAYFGTSLLLFGAALFGVAAVVQGWREHDMAAIERQADASLAFDALPSPAVVDGGTGASAPAPMRLDDRPVSRTAAAAVGVGDGKDLGAGAEGSASPMPDHIMIPAIGVEAPVVEVGWEARIVNGEAQGNVWETADFAAGFHTDSARPGDVGNIVISGHNNVKGAVFQNLYDLDAGDPIYLYAGERTWAYTVAHKLVVRESEASAERRRQNARWIEPTPDERLTLVSCYPRWGNTHRVIIVARPSIATVVQAAAAP
ncbi:hypothetical protein DCC79_00745 [bacterium]|nr:sortase [Chloroflexi bacterium CFX6]RIL12609.1 MAG: hypothetical protein DCC79_00745 [bacterium]